MSTKSRVGSLAADVAVGRFTFTVFRFTMLRLTSINDASRKNMMSISGMISIRASAFSAGRLEFNLTGMIHLLIIGQERGCARILPGHVRAGGPIAPKAPRG